MPASEVEALVVQAIGKRIVEARIDQLRGTVSVAKCVPRTFGAGQWRELQGQLAVWKVRWCVVGVWDRLSKCVFCLMSFVAGEGLQGQLVI